MIGGLGEGYKKLKIQGVIKPGLLYNILFFAYDYKLILDVFNIWFQGDGT